jgi:hypothetical protein
MRSLRLLTMVAVLGLLAGAGPASCQEVKIDISKLPKKVVDAIKAKFPDAQLMKASSEKENNVTLYEVGLKSKGQNISMTLKSDGSIVEVERDIAAKDLPGAVTKTLEAKYPKATYQKTEEVTKGDQMFYEVVLVTAAKKKFEVVISPQGKIMNVESKDKKKEEKK